MIGKLLRLVGHGEHDDASYVDANLEKIPLGQDCLAVSESFLIEQGWATADEITAWRREAKTEVDATAAKVQREPGPDPADEEWTAISTRNLEDRFADSCS